MAFKVPEKFRVKTGPMASCNAYGNNGAFDVKNHRFPRIFNVVASDGENWEHVSVSLPDRCPTWSEMHFIKCMFWGEMDRVMQLHPPKSEYVNNHPYCLHLWRPINKEIPAPPSILVGIK